MENSPFMDSLAIFDNTLLEGMSLWFPANNFGHPSVPTISKLSPIQSFRVATRTEVWMDTEGLFSSEVGLGEVGIFTWGGFPGTYPPQLNGFFEGKSEHQIDDIWG